MNILQSIILHAYAQTGGSSPPGSSSPPPAGGGSGGGIRLENPLSSGTVQGLIDNIITQALVYVGIIVAIFIIVGAFQMLTAAGDPEKFKKGQKTIVYAVIGFAVALLAKGISAIIERVLNG